MSDEQLVELRRLIADWQQRRQHAIRDDSGDVWQRYMISCCETLKDIAELLEGAR